MFNAWRSLEYSDGFGRKESKNERKLYKSFQHVIIEIHDFIELEEVQEWPQKMY